MYISEVIHEIFEKEKKRGIEKILESVFGFFPGSAIFVPVFLFVKG